MGFLADLLPQRVQQHGADLVVMGMRGMSTTERLLLGSVTASVLLDTQFPLLVVPATAHFRAPSRILFASDYASLTGGNMIPLLRQIAQHFHAQVEVLHIEKPEPALSSVHDRVAFGPYLEHVFRDIKHQYIFVPAESVEKGLTERATPDRADLLVMVPQRRGFLSRLLTPSRTRRLAFSTQIPLLVLPNPD
jgi:nucleotide-binding universal stress UspA family protein